jgi:hypothetical protein
MWEGAGQHLNTSRLGVSSWQEIYIRFTNESKRVEEDTGQVVCVHPIFKEAVVLYGLTKN